jgi:hypothetical protein
MLPRDTTQLARTTTDLILTRLRHGIFYRVPERSLAEAVLRLVEIVPATACANLPVAQHYGLSVSTLSSTFIRAQVPSLKQWQTEIRLVFIAAAREARYTREGVALVCGLSSGPAVDRFLRHFCTTSWWAFRTNGSNTVGLYLDALCTTLAPYAERMKQTTLYRSRPAE